jgi:hypothetical protein
MQQLLQVLNEEWVLSNYNDNKDNCLCKSRKMEIIEHAVSSMQN